MWIQVLNDDLERFRYPDCGMDDFAEVTSTGKANVPDAVAEQLFDHPSGDFAPVENDTDES